MIIKLNDGRELNAYTYSASGSELRIRFLNVSTSDLKEVFSDAFATKRITIEGKVYTDYHFDFITEYTGEIIEVGLVASGSEEDSATAAAVLTLAKIQAADLDDDQAIEVKVLFPIWDGDGVAYKAGQRIQYLEDLYKILQDHISQQDWTPDVAVSLYVKIDDPSIEYPEWHQPTGAHDAYEKGAKVSHLGKHWTSDIDANVYEPSVYGWTEVI